MIGKCIVCGKDNYYKPSRPERFCSKKCVAIYRIGKSLPHKGKPWSEARRKTQKIRLFIVEKKYTLDWEKIREKIYKKDNWTCQECGIKCHGNGTKDKIQCHHIDYDTKNNNENNLITLCASCHMKTNFRRSDWINYYNNIQSRKKGLT